MVDVLLVGRVRRPHGLEGEVSVEPLTEFPERFAPGVSLLWRGGAPERRLKLTAARPHGDRWLLRFEGIGNVEAARALQGGDLCVPVGQAHPAPEGFFYEHEIRGFWCEDKAGRRLGRAAGLERTAAGPMLSLENAAGKEVLVPFVEEIVLSVDRKSRRIVLDPPEGLLEL